MQILVTGSRTWKDSARIWKVLSELEQLSPGQTNILVHGGCKKGVDALAHSYAEIGHWETIVVKANWSEYGRYAGPERNERMVTQYGPTTDVFLVCSRNYSNGTEDCARLIRQVAKKPGAMIMYLRET